MNRRVVVTGMNGITALGNDWNTIHTHLASYKNCVKNIDEWKDIKGLRSNLSAPIENFIYPTNYPRKKTRSMSRVSLLATVATENALKQAGLIDDPILKTSRCGVAYGSSVGSTQSISDMGRFLIDKNTYSIDATTYVKMMPHTIPVNLSIFFGTTGRIIPTSTACTSGSQAIGYAYEAIKYGLQDIMIAGGAEELCVSEVAVFDVLYATSSKNNTPNLTPSPFDKNRDGLVIGEGSGTLILEEYEHAKARGAKIYAELIGFSTNSDASHITEPNVDSIKSCINQALIDAKLPANAIGYISAHGTGTIKGDIAETKATASIFGNSIPFSSLKSYTGHTLGACGAIEAWLSIEMMNHKTFSPTLNLNEVDDLCGDLNYITQSMKTLDIEYVQSNNFAFGGVNTSLIFKKYL